MNKLLILVIVFLASLAPSQTFQVTTTAAVNAGQCVALDGHIYKPCNNFRTPAPAVPIGVSLNTVPASAPHTAGHTVIIQYAGLATIPNTSYGGLINSGDYLGDVDGTGNLNDLSVPQTGPVYSYLGPTFAGIAIGELSGNILMIVQPGYWPSIPPATMLNAKPTRKHKGQ